MTFSIQVENIKCGGCANTIRKRLGQIPGVGEVQVDVEQGLVRIEGDESLRLSVAESLLHAGYPETGSASGITALKAKATSFVSCAIGRVSDKS